ncbi:hypothetical protein ACFQ3W_25880 [Paenibacillus puldeungensis]|uniref:Uncharacterized protein n=1 Tax=Paenibacillus puldeungensis TaxID=696536 RepID=A0ABW3S4R2_9BACL
MYEEIARRLDDLTDKDARSILLMVFGVYEHEKDEKFLRLLDQALKVIDDRKQE